MERVWQELIWLSRKEALYCIKMENVAYSKRGKIMIWLDTKEEVDFDWFMDVLRNNELQVISRKLTKEDDEEVCRAVAEYKAMQQETLATEAVLA
jgi:hypothetical protein